MNASSKRWKPCLAVLLAAIFTLPMQALARSTDIAEVRAQPVGSTVTAVGVVSVPSGAFVPNNTGFAIQDSHAGLYVHRSLDMNLQVGQVVRVTGRLVNSFGQVLGIRPTTIEVLGTAPVPPPHPHKTGDISEETEGRLVRIKGLIVTALQEDAPYGWKFDVDDGTGPTTVFVTAGTGIDVSGLRPGQRVVIEGFSAQFLDHWEVDPRFQDDIRVLQEP